MLGYIIYKVCGTGRCVGAITITTMVIIAAPGFPPGVAIHQRGVAAHQRGRNVYEGKVGRMIFSLLAY